jgi:hypothetical protein
LLVRQTRLDQGARYLAPLLWLLGLALGFSVGLDLGSLSQAHRVDRLLTLGAALIVPLPIAALSALYHDRLHALALPWPLSAGQHWRIGWQLLGGRFLLWLAIGAGIAVGAGFNHSPLEIALLTGYMTSFLVGGYLCALGAAGMCAYLADAEGDLAKQLRQSLAGGFAGERHAPYFYLPAAGFAIALVAGIAAEAGLLRLLAALSSKAGATAHSVASFAARDWALLAAPLAVGIAVLAAGFYSYRATALRAIARVQEEARTIYGGRPAPAEPPYGAWLAHLLPRTIVPYFKKELREQARGHRALWAMLALAALGASLYAINVGETVSAAPLLGLVLALWIATLPTRRAPRAGGVAFMMTLPTRALSSLIGRYLALFWPVAHLAIAVGGALGSQHDTHTGLTVAGLALSVAFAAVGLTRNRPGLTGYHWGMGTRLLLPAALLAGWTVLRYPLYAPVTIVAFFALGLISGLGLFDPRGRASAAVEEQR